MNTAKTVFLLIALSFASNTAFGVKGKITTYTCPQENEITWTVTGASGGFTPEQSASGVNLPDVKFISGTITTDHRVNTFRCGYSLGPNSLFALYASPPPTDLAKCTLSTDPAHKTLTCTE